MGSGDQRGKLDPGLVEELARKSKARFYLTRTAGDGRPLSAHLKVIYDQTGKKPDSLAAAEEPIDSRVAHIEGWYWELARCRNGNGFGGLDRIGWTDIAAWAQFTGRKPEPWEVDCLLMLDAIYISTVTAKEGSDG